MYGLYGNLSQEKSIMFLFDLSALVMRERIGHFRVSLCLCFKVRSHSYENDFDLHENKTACRTHFHMKGFALRLVLKQRHKRTRKWPIKSELKAGFH